MKPEGNIFHLASACLAMSEATESRGHAVRRAHLMRLSRNFTFDVSSLRDFEEMRLA